MRSLVMARRGTPLGHLVTGQLLSVDVDAHIDELEDLFDRIDFSAVPVADEAGKFVGVIQRHAVREARSEAAEEDLAKFGGILRGEELRTMPLVSRALRRLAYLVPIAGLLMLSASVIRLFIDTVDKVPILAMFLPVVSGICGSGGGQAVAVSMREISLGLIKPADLWRVMRKEMTVALVNGLVIGTLLFFGIWAWQGSALLGLVVGAALPIVLVVAKGVGGTVPLLMRQLKLDPAMASVPAVTTVTDLIAFLVVLTFATAALSRLTL
jgi:magnesium transporter